MLNNPIIAYLAVLLSPACGLCKKEALSTAFKRELVLLYLITDCVWGNMTSIQLHGMEPTTHSACTRPRPQRTQVTLR
jgi:hypothetical protein